jgi:serine protease AprX
MADERSKFRGGPDRLPIKVIMPKQGTERRVSGGGNRPAPFRAVDDDFRQRLKNQVSAATQALRGHLRKNDAAPLRVNLLKRALAKSHRPNQLFSDETCPIIGAGKQGELFIRGSQKGLDKLMHIISSGATDKIVKELSSVESIEPISAADRRRGRGPGEILRTSPRGFRGFLLRVKLFDLGNALAQSTLVDEFKRACAEHRIILSKRGYSEGTYTFSADCRDEKDVEVLSSFIGVRSVNQMPLVRIVRERMFSLSPLPNVPARGDADSDLPVVVVVDSGISENLPALNSWVVGRQSNVAPSYRNTDHGTFVAGLICWGGLLNPNLKGISDDPCGVFDLQVIPNSDPERGETDALTESELLSALDTALQQHSNRYRVWNLSLGSDTICSLDEFSPLAEELDNLQEKYKVSFVISAGNYLAGPHWVVRVEC